jgi:hypothetical protein
MRSLSQFAVGCCRSDAILDPKQSLAKLHRTTWAARNAPDGWAASLANALRLTESNGLADSLAAALLDDR